MIIAEHSSYLLVLDGLNHNSLHLPFVKRLLNLEEGHLIYTTSQNIQSDIPKELAELTLNIAPIIILPFTSQEIGQLVEIWFPNETIQEDHDFLEKLTGGRPDFVTDLCQYYENSLRYENFESFLSQLKAEKSAFKDLSKLVSNIINKDLEALERVATSNDVAMRAQNSLKQVAWLDDQSVPYEFFINNNQETDYEAIHSLKRLAILTQDSKEQQIRLIPVFRSALQQIYSPEQVLALSKNIDRLSDIFGYLTDNESSQGKHSKPEALLPYRSLVESILFNITKPDAILKDESQLSKLLALGSSLARLYYMHHKELQLAHHHLQEALKLFEHGLSKSLIETFQKNPASVQLPTPSPEKKRLLELYAQEYLYQMGTIESQLLDRAEANANVIQNFQHSYAIQQNLELSPLGIAYTLRNLSRVLRKAEKLSEAKDCFQKIEELINQHRFDAIEGAKLRIDEGIMLKESEDKKIANKSYKNAILTLEKARDYFKKHSIDDQYNRQLSFASFYLGLAYLADSQFSTGIYFIYKAMHYGGELKYNQARVYFELAKACHENQCEALASLYVEKAIPLQFEAYKHATYMLKAQVNTALESVPIPSTTPISPDDCHQRLVAISQLQGITPDLIEKYNSACHAWYDQQRVSKAQKDQQVKMAMQKENLNRVEAVHSTTCDLEQANQRVWYGMFTHRINLGDSEHRNTYTFVKQLEKSLLNEICRKIDVADGTTGNTEIISSLTQTLSGVGLSMATNVTGGQLGINLPAFFVNIKRAAINNLSNNDKRIAKSILEKFGSPEKMDKDLQQRVDGVVNYIARCYDPLLSEKWANQLDEETIILLADNCARRMIEYPYPTHANNLHDNEIAMFAVQNPQSDKRQKIERLGISVNDFFEKPGVKLENDGREAFYITTQSDPKTYGFRWGSLTEVKRLGYKGPFNNTTEAESAVDVNPVLSARSIRSFP